MDMNRLVIENADGPSEVVADYGVVSDDGNVEVVLRDIPRALIGLMRQYPAAVGCVAWLTHFDILDALARLKAVSVVVQKEDFLRPDTDWPSDWKNRLRRKYDALPGDERMTHSGCVVGGLSYGGDPTLQGVRCVGNHNSTKNPAFPRAHHKFMVFGDILPGQHGEYFGEISFPVDERVTRGFGRIATGETLRVVLPVPPSLSVTTSAGA